MAALKTSWPMSCICCIVITYAKLLTDYYFVIITIVLY